MKRRSIALAFAALVLSGGEAAAAQLTVLATGSMGAPLQHIAKDFAKRTGHEVNVTVGITTTVTATLQAGDSADLVEVTSAGMDQLARENLILAESRREIACAVIGLALKDSAAPADISTQDAVKRVLANAKRIAYVNPRFAGQVGVNMMAFLDKLAIKDAVAKKASLALTGEEAVQKVAKGEADLVIAFVSEILPVRGVKWLGPCPLRFRFQPVIPPPSARRVRMSMQRACCLMRFKAALAAASSPRPAWNRRDPLKP